MACVARQFGGDGVVTEAGIGIGISLTIFQPCVINQRSTMMKGVGFAKCPYRSNT